MDPKFLIETLEPMGPSLIVRFQFDEGKYPFLQTISSILYDIELAHDLAVILSYRDYANYSFGHNFWYRNGRRISLVHKLRAFSIEKQSPLTLEVVVAAIGGIWLLIQIVEKVAHWRLNKDKLMLEMEKLRKENALKELETIERIADLETKLEERHANTICERLIRRLDEIPAQLVELEIHLPNQTKDDSRGKE